MEQKEVTSEIRTDRVNSVEWMRRGDARKFYGVGKDLLDLWVFEDIVEAHKLNPGRNGTVVFSASDIREAIRNAPSYKPKIFSRDGLTTRSVA